MSGIGSGNHALEVPKQGKAKKVAFVFSGGGARGAVQVGMVRRVLESGIEPDIVTGNSIGAANGYFVAQRKIDDLERFWRSIKGSSDVYHTRFLGSLLMFVGWQWGYPSLYNTGPAAKRLRAIVRARKKADFSAELRIGAVDLLSGDFVSVNQDHPLLDKFLLCSMAIPIAFQPIRVKKKESKALAGLYCDGCVRNLTPVSQAVGLGATELHIFLSNGKMLQRISQGPKSWLAMVQRVINVNLHELVVDDIERVILSSRAASVVPHTGPVPQSPGLDVFVYHTGDAVLQDMLDFDPRAIREAIALGYKLAQNPVTTNILIDEFGTQGKGMPHGYYYVEEPTYGHPAKKPYDSFLRDRQVG